ncbi:MAG TPA: hypothetical protein VGL56_18810 [Fimbriimonadaceae bacterium]|jgi:hypothetical protein
MKPNPILLFCYRLGMLLYPRAFRKTYGEQLLLTLKDAYVERRSSIGFWLGAYLDLSGSILRQRWEDAKNHSVRYAAATAVVSSFAILVMAILWQQTLRRGADQPQGMIVDTMASQMARGAPLRISNASAEMNSTVRPFLIFYGNDGKPKWSTVFLNRKIPTPPTGIFDNLSRDGSEKFTWQPQPGIRVAAVARSVKGGFLVAGRSLQFTEVREAQARVIVVSLWLVLMATLIGFAASGLRRNLLAV